MANYANIDRKRTYEQFINDYTVIGVPAIQKLLSYTCNGDPTITKPVNKRDPNSYTDFDMLARGLSVYLFNWMKEDLRKINSSITNTKYNIPPIEPNQYKEFTCDIITISSNDVDVYQLVKRNAIPSVYDIYKYLNYLKEKLNFIPPNLILTCIYLKRICDKANISLNITNYQLLFTVTLIIAQKIWVMPFKQTEDFTVLFPSNYSINKLSLWEEELNNLIDDVTIIESSLYDIFYGNFKELSNQVTVIFIPNEEYDNGKKSERTAVLNLVDNTDDNSNKFETRSFHSVDNINVEINSVSTGAFTNDIVSIQSVLSKPNLLELLGKGVTNDQLKKLGYTIIDFVKAGYQIPDLLTAEFTLKELLNVKKHCDQSNGNVVTTEYFTVYDLKEQGGFTITDFLNEGFSLLDLKSSGFVALDYMRCGVSIDNLIDAGYGREELLVKLKYTPLQLTEFKYVCKSIQ